MYEQKKNKHNKLFCINILFLPCYCLAINKPCGCSSHNLETQVRTIHTVTNWQVIWDRNVININSIGVLLYVNTIPKGNIFQVNARLKFNI